MKLIVGNFKMNLLIDDINNYLKELSNQDFFNVVYCPSYIYLSNFIDNNLVVGAQDVSSHENGAYTGEVSATQLKQLGVKYAIIGHSERRKYFNESDILLDKVKICLKEGIIPIFIRTIDPCEVFRTDFLCNRKFFEFPLHKKPPAGCAARGEVGCLRHRLRAKNVQSTFFYAI